LVTNEKKGADSIDVAVWLPVSCGSMTRRHRGTSDAADARMEARIESADEEEDDEEEDNDAEEEEDEDKEDKEDDDEENAEYSTPTYAPGSRSSM
jgi:hypothetical protein